jgi:hypothetical protein
MSRSVTRPILGESLARVQGRDPSVVLELSISDLPTDAALSRVGWETKLYDAWNRRRASSERAATKRLRGE